MLGTEDGKDLTFEVGAIEGIIVGVIRGNW